MLLIAPAVGVVVGVLALSAWWALELGRRSRIAAATWTCACILFAGMACVRFVPPGGAPPYDGLLWIVIAGSLVVFNVLTVLPISVAMELVADQRDTGR